MSDFESVLYETPAEHIARIVLNRPETRNAQDTKLLYELNSAFDRAAQGDDQSYYPGRKRATLYGFFMRSIHERGGQQRRRKARQGAHPSGGVVQAGGQ